MTFIEHPLGVRHYIEQMDKVQNRLGDITKMILSPLGKGDNGQVIRSVLRAPEGKYKGAKEIYMI